VRWSDLRMICRSRVLPMDHPPAPEIAKAAQIAKLVEPGNVVASGCGRRGSRGLICRWPPLTALPASRARGQPTESAAGDPAPRNVVAPGCRTGRGTYSRTRLMRFTQDRRPTCSRARIASYTVPLAQPAASAIASYDGEALAGRGVVQAPEQRGEHRQRLRADLAVGPCLSPGGASGRAPPSSRGPWRCGRHEAAGAKDLLPRADASL
jgi:hypothetical protein